MNSSTTVYTQYIKKKQKYDIATLNIVINCVTCHSKVKIPWDVCCYLKFVGDSDDDVVTFVVER